MYNIYIDNQFSEINGASMFEKIMSKTNTYNNLNNEIIDLKNENRLLKKQIKLMKNHWHSTEDYNYLKNTFSSINKENNMLKKELENCNNLKKQNDDLKKELILYEARQNSFKKRCHNFRREFYKNIYKSDGEFSEEEIYNIHESLRD